MFDKISLVSHSAEALAEIEKIQEDFLLLSGNDVPSLTKAYIDELMSLAERGTSIEKAGLYRKLRITRYQNPEHQQDLMISANFATECLERYLFGELESVDFGFLKDIPLATIQAPSLTGFVHYGERLGTETFSRPYIFMSQNCMQTSWVCQYVHSLIRDAIGSPKWKQVANEPGISASIEAKDAAPILSETIQAFFCNPNETKSKHYSRAKGGQREAIYLLVSYLVSHEYAHVVLGHSARLNADSNIVLSHSRLANLTDMMMGFSETQKRQIPTTTEQLKYFFGYQQYELDADFVALKVLYQGILAQRRGNELLSKLLWQVCYSLLWTEINETVGRIFHNGSEWFSDLMYKPELCLIGDLLWRRRYPSGFSRVAYLYQASEELFLEQHHALFLSIIQEATVLFSFWRDIIIRFSDNIFSIYNSECGSRLSWKDSYVWKGMPQSVRGAVGYNDPTEAFRVYRLDEYLSS